MSTMALFFGRFHIVRVFFGAILLVIGVTILYRKNSLVDNYGTSVIHIPSEAIDSLSMTIKEVDALTRANETCPLCFGRDACDELMNDVQLGRLKVERRPFPSPDGTNHLHRVYRNGKVRFWLRPKPQDSSLIKTFEDAMCRKDNSQRFMKGKTTCNFESASSLLQTSPLDLESITMLHRNHLVSSRRIPLTTCPTWRLVEGLVKAFDENDDKTLTGVEKSYLLTTLASNPEIAIYRFVLASRLQFPMLPFFGACGRATFIQGPTKPLSSFLDEPAIVRIDLASQILQLIDGFLNDDSTWLIFTTALTIDNFIVTEGGQVFLNDLNEVMLIDKELFPDEDGSGKYRTNSDSMICDINCFENFYDSLFISGDIKQKNEKVKPKTSENYKTSEKCYEIHKYAPHMFTLVCKNVLRTNYNTKGLLHSLINLKISDDNTSEIDSKEVDLLLKKCAEDSDLSLRESAAMELIEILAGDEGEEDIDNAGEDTDDNEEDEDEGTPDDNDGHDSNDVGGEVLKNEDEHIGDEDLGEDQYDKTHDMLPSKKKKPKEDIGDIGNLKYDLNDFDDDMLSRHKKQKDVQFP